MSVNMALSTQPYKGARDFYPEDKRFQKYMFKTLGKVAERFGYEEIDAPILEPLELYTAKSGDELANEQTYTFTDRGDRKVAIRPEMTPTVSRMLAGRRQEMAYPVRWYCIPNFWRYERPQRGRLREFWQLNVDIFGVEGIEAEHEIIMIADQNLKAFGAKPDMYTIKINSRKLINALFNDYLQVDQTQAQTLARLIDRMHKTDPVLFAGQVDAVFTPSQREVGAGDKLLGFLKVKTLEELPESLRMHESVEELRKLMGLLAMSGVKNAIFDITVMRGLDYYTDIVFEVFDNHPDNNRSMFGGGRYDGLVGMFGVDPVPTVGFGMGDVTLQNFIEVHNLLPKLHPEIDVYVVMIGDVYIDAQHAIQHLRKMGVNVAVDSTGRKPEKQLKSAIKKGVGYALFIGENEVKNEQYMLKNLVTGQEEAHALERIVSIVKRRSIKDISDEE